MPYPLVVARVQRQILVVRGCRVMLDHDLARLYGVGTKRLNEQVRRNRRRFPTDFMFRLTRRETREVVAICDHLRHLKFSSTLPYAFTEHGAVMLASVLKSSRAISVSIYVVRAFVRLKKALTFRGRLTHALMELEQRLDRHDVQIQSLIKAIRALIAPPEPPRRQIGFHAASSDRSRIDGGRRRC